MATKATVEPTIATARPYEGRGAVLPQDKNEPYIDRPAPVRTSITDGINEPPGVVTDHGIHTSNTLNVENKIASVSEITSPATTDRRNLRPINVKATVVSGTRPLEEQKWRPCSP